MTFYMPARAIFEGNEDIIFEYPRIYYITMTQKTPLSKWIGRLVQDLYSEGNAELGNMSFENLPTLMCTPHGLGPVTNEDPFDSPGPVTPCPISPTHHSPLTPCRKTSRKRPISPPTTTTAAVTPTSPEGFVSMRKKICTPLDCHLVKHTRKKCKRNAPPSIARTPYLTRAMKNKRFHCFGAGNNTPLRIWRGILCASPSAQFEKHRSVPPQIIGSWG